MFRGDMFESVESVLPEVYNLVAERMGVMHMTACEDCKAKGEISRSCYFYAEMHFTWLEAKN